MEGPLIACSMGRGGLGTRLYSMLGYTGECTYVHVHEQYLHINGIPRSVPRILTYIHVFIKLIHSLGVFI